MNRKNIKGTFSQAFSTSFICLLLVAVTLSLYWQTGSHSFVNYDDPEYVFENFRVLQGITFDNLKWAFTTTTFSNWHPLTWIAYMLQVEFFGVDPGPFHLTNVILHIINTLLLFLLFTRMTGNILPSALIALLFAIHPLHIQSVAWIAELKDLLSGLFFITTIYLYTLYIKNGGLFRYLLTLACYFLGIMSKPMIITLPCVLLLLDFWPLGRMKFSKSNENNPTVTIQVKNTGISSIIYEKIPFFILSSFSAFMTFTAQEEGGSVASITQLPLILRAENAVVSYVLYMYKTIWPLKLSIIYPHPWAAHPFWLILLSLCIISVITIWCIYFIKKSPFLFMGWLWFLGMLVPVIGIIQVGVQAMADRYTYLPNIGLYIAFSWGLHSLSQSSSQFKKPLLILLFLVTASLAIRTNEELKYWKDGYTLFSKAIEVTDNNYVAHNNLGYALIQKQKYQEAKSHFEKSLEIDPTFSIAHLNLAKSLIEENKIDEGIRHYRKAIEHKPDYADAYKNLGNVYLQLGKFREAAGYFIQALQYNPYFKETYNNLGVILSNDGKIDQAIAMFNKAIEIDPHYTDARNNLKIAIDRQQRNSTSRPEN